MSGEVKEKILKNLDYSKANCNGLNTNLFFLDDNKLREHGLTYNGVRKVCFNCEIRTECMKQGFAEEDYGMFGGLTEWERRVIKGGKRYSEKLISLNSFLRAVGMTIDEMLEGWDG